MGWASDELAVATPLAYGVTAGLGAAAAAAVVVAARRRPGGWTTVVARLLGILLLADAVSFVVAVAVGGAFSFSTSLPLPLCDMAVLVAAGACWWQVPLLVEITYFWGLAGTLQAIVTPDLGVGFPHLVFFQYLVGHLGIVTAALLLVVGMRVVPRRNAVARVLGISLAYTAFVGSVDALTGANYMFLRQPPGSWSLLDVLGPWPWYVLGAGGVALVLFVLLDTPFRVTRSSGGRRSQQSERRSEKAPIPSSPHQRHQERSSMDRGVVTNWSEAPRGAASPQLSRPTVSLATIGRGSRRMDPQPLFRSDLYRGTASFYDRYRPPYPKALFDDLCERLPVSGTGRLLDLGCGTGQIAVPLAGRFAGVVAVDQEPESVAFGRAKAEMAENATIHWMTGAAETVTLDASFELVTVGNAFHRLNRPLVAERMSSWVRPRGGVALLWSDMPWQGAAPWQRELTELVVAWMTDIGTIERIPPGWGEAMARDPHEVVLASAGFDYVGRFEFTREERWTAESLLGFMCSTSILNQDALGNRAGELERDLGSLVHSHAPGGAVVANASYAYQLARQPS